MIAFALIAVACGAALRLRVNVYALIPASFLLVLAVLVLGYTQDFSALKTAAIAAVLLTCLQSGYLGSAALAGALNASRKRRNAVTAH